MIPFLLIGTCIQSLPKRHPFLNKLLPRAFGKLKECYSDLLNIHEAFSQNLGFVVVPTHHKESISGILTKHSSSMKYLVDKMYSVSQKKFMIAILESRNML